MNDLMVTDEKSLIETFSRLEQGGLIKFHSMTPEKIEKIADNMPAINRGCRSFGRSDSQVTRKLMSLQMISCTPYRTLRQILAQIERKRSAIKENAYKAMKEQVEIEKLENKLNSDVDEYERKLILIDLHQKRSNLADAGIYYEGALKEIGALQKVYFEVMESNGIPEDWDELDMEGAEIGEHVRMVFEHAHRDILQTGRLNMGTMEYCQQYGITPETVMVEVNNYLNNKEINHGDIDTLYGWLDSMFEKYGEEHKKAMNRLGIKTLIDEDWLYKETR